MSSLETEINAYFVKTRPNETDNEDFKNAPSVLRLHVNENSIRHIKASEGYPLIASGLLTKRDVFIFDHFEGDFFKQLQQTKSLIIGPRCLMACLNKSEPIPLGTSPVYTTAMRDLKISASGVTQQEKDQLSTKIQWMGGHYFQNFGRQVTHLISNTIKSSKYEYATLNGIPVMHIDWIQRVWERSLVDYISASDKEFDSYRLPIFYGINVTSTGLDTTKKNEVMRLVQENGGTYHRAFRSQLVDIVITEKGKTNSDKYQAAMRYKKDILSSEWIFDSIQKGFALPTKDYQVKSLKVSTPTKSDQSIADFTSTDHTQLSEISRISSAGISRRNIDVTVNDTICSTMNDTQKNEPKSLPPEHNTITKESSKNLQRDVLKKTVDSSAQYRVVLEEISPREAKKAGNFLDGCCIYLSGFRTVEKEKLNRILNAGGATRYDLINDEITHVIVGQLSDADVRSWRKDGLRSAVNIVRLEWLLESIKQKQAANENIYRVSLPTSCEPDAPSPSSKKTLRSMNHSFKQPEAPPKKKLFEANFEKTSDNMTLPNEFSNLPNPKASSTEMPIPMEEEEHELLAQYSQENMAAATPPIPLPLPAVTTPISAEATASMSAAHNSEFTSYTIDYENLNVFRNLVIYVHKENYPEEFYSQIQRECEAAHGNVVGENFRDFVDYAVVSFECTVDVAHLPVKAKNIVTELYVESCMKENKLVPIEYYHKPIPHTANAQPLKGMTIVISSYTELERDYVSSLAQLLGANVNNTYSKKEQPLLVCPAPEGAKYEGALKWRFPVVTSAWLVQCAEQGEKISTRPYLVGESPENFPTPTSLVKSNETPARVSDVTPLRNRRVSELVTNIRSNPMSNNATPNNNNLLDSPHTPSNAQNYAAYSMEFMEKILADIDDASDRECVRGIIEEIRANPTPELERIKRQVCTPINRRVSYTPKVISDFYNTPEFKRRMVEEFDKRWHLPTKKLKPSTPIDQIRKRVLRETCKNLGIPVSDDEDNILSKSNYSTLKSTTPTNEVTKNNSLSTVKSASNAHGTPILQRTSSRMEPRSIFGTQTSNDANRSIQDNTFVPNTQEEALDKSNVSQAGGVRPSLLGKSTLDFDKISFEETNVDMATRKFGTSSSTLIARESPELKQITDFLRERESRRESLRKEQNMDKMETEGIPIQPFESEQLYLDSEEKVEWRDPIDFNKEKLKKKRRTMQYEGTPRFSISCSDETQREAIIAKIYKLGGEVCENLVNFDPNCTHFICERPNRGEKILGCISSGKWVLSLKYIEECYAKDVFIDEELYEWGNTKAINLPEISDDDQIVARAAHRWRTELTENNTPNAGIFSGMKAILRIGPKTLESLSNVLKAGKGETIIATSPYSKSSNAHLATHCFVDVKKMPLQRDDYNYLKEHGVKIASYLYIQAFMFNGASADFSAYEIKM